MDDPDDWKPTSVRKVVSNAGTPKLTRQRRSKRLQEKLQPADPSLSMCSTKRDATVKAETSISDIEYLQTSEDESSENSSDGCSTSSSSPHHFTTTRRVLRQRNIHGGKVSHESNKRIKGSSNCFGSPEKHLKEQSGPSHLEQTKQQSGFDDDDGKHLEENLNTQNMEDGSDGALCHICQIPAASSFVLQCSGIGCVRMFHTFCLLPPLKELERNWLCSWCKEQLPLCEIQKPKKVQKVVGYRRVDAGPKESAMREEYLLKWDSLSHNHDTWVPADWMFATERIRLYSYQRNHPIMEDTVVDQRKPEWFKIDRVIACRKKRDSSKICKLLPKFNEENDDLEYLVKWMGLDYCDVTWESSPTEELLSEVKRFIERHKLASERRDDDCLKSTLLHYDKSPEFLGGVLYDYQLQGLNWILGNFKAGRNVILADEMGLGKTVQVVSFIQCLKHEKLNSKPILIIAPKSILFFWEKEFRMWAQGLNAIIYQGEKESRRCIKQHELYSSKQEVLFDVLVTNYEMILSDDTVLRKFQWSSIIIDEGHKIKNLKCKLGNHLKHYITDFRLLLTGTPLQNTLLELFTLLHFLDPEKFSDPEAEAGSFARIGNGGSREELLKISELHDILKPRMLRRMKHEVLPGCIPAKKWVEVPCSLTDGQRELYINILEKNHTKLNGGIQHGKKIVLNFILMQLRKCCNHPYLFPGQEQSYQSNTETVAAMTASSGKLQLLEKLLPNLKKQGHRILLFAQMTKMLDILEDFLLFLGLTYFRIDGSTGISLRQQQMNDFNDPESNVFVFLISTRAGGLGINLPSADRVIIYDPDFNPFMDLQAQSRAHRIGQSRPVVVYQLITKCTVEEKILQKSKEKLAVEYLVMNHSRRLHVEELHSVLLHGAKKIRGRKYTKAMTIHYDDKAIEALLSIAPAPGETCTSDENGYLGGIQSFNVEADEPEQPSSPPKVEDWEEILGSIEGMKSDLGRGKRQKKAVRYDSDSASDNDEIYAPDSDPVSSTSDESDADQPYNDV